MIIEDKERITSTVGLFIFRLFCLITVVILSIFILLGIRELSLSLFHSSISVSLLLKLLVLFAVLWIDYFVISIALRSRTLHISEDGVHIGEKVVQWNRIGKIRCFRGNLPQVSIRFAEDGRNKKVIGVLPIFGARKYAELIKLSLAKHGDIS